MTRWGLSLCLLLAIASIGRAQEDPDTQAARRHFQRGQELYDLEKYDEAEREFETAKSLKPNPAFDYNIGRCFDRLERWSEAADAYQRYLDANPSVSGAAELKERIALLRARAQHPTETAPPHPTEPDAGLDGDGAARARRDQPDLDGAAAQEADLQARLVLGRAGGRRGRRRRRRRAGRGLRQARHQRRHPIPDVHF